MSADRIDWNLAGQSEYDAAREFVPEAPGWLPPEDRTTATQRQHEQFVFDTPLVSEVFASAGSNADRPKVWELIKPAIAKGLVPEKYVRNGTLKNLSQLIGSCVGAGVGNGPLFWGSTVDAIHRQQPERIVVPFWPYCYGRGRFHAGISGSGSGSTGSGQAKALQVDGYLPHDHGDGVPDATFGDAVVWTSGIETQWSNGAKIDGKYIAAAKNHLCTNVARVSSTDEAAQLADSFYTFTIASNWGGRMKCPIVDGVLLNERVGSWSHQMSVLDYAVVPKLGRIWYVLNQWRYPHGECPPVPGREDKPAPPEGGFFIKDADLAWIIRQRETYAFTDPQGFVDRSRAFDWLLA